MKTNLLDNWEKSIYVDSSGLNPNRKLEVNRDNVQDVKKQLEDFFSTTFFEVETFSKYLKMENPIGSNWIHSLLTTTNPKAVNQLFELATVIQYYQNRDPVLLNNLLIYKDLKTFRQFRDYYLELYTLFLFDKNHIENQKKIYEGNKELEGEAILNGKRCLLECKKLYNDKADNLKMNTQIVKKLSEKFHKKAYPIIVAVKYTNPRLSFLNILAKEVEKIIASWESPKRSLLICPISKKYYNGEVELYVEPYSPGRIESVIEESKGANYTVFGIKPDMLEGVQRFGHFLQSISSEVVSTDTEIENQLLKNIIKKRKNRANSSYDYRIYFFESENYPGFDRGLFSPNGLSERIKEKVKEYLMAKKTKDIIVLLEKDSYELKVPRIRKTIIGNEGTEEICRILEQMKYDFFTN